MEEILADKINTIISRRDYRTDALYTIALWHKGKEKKPSLSELQAALCRPSFTLYLGRKSCPPALPLAPHIIEASHLKEAFEHAEFASKSLLEGLPDSGERIYVWEMNETPGMEALHVTARRDEPTSRRRWHFANRDEYYLSETHATSGRGE